MAWTTQSLADTRTSVRNYLSAALSIGAIIANSVLRVLADATGAVAFSVLAYLDWISKQLLPDTAEDEWLDRHANIWLKNADGSVGRKAGSFASGSVSITGIQGALLPSGSTFQGGNITYQSVDDVSIADGPTTVAVRAIDTGAAGNQDQGVSLSLSVAVSGVDAIATAVSLTGGADPESDDDLRSRVLFRIQHPPMGGDADDYVQWALSFPGVTRAWCSPNEQGVGTVTVRFMMDNVYAPSGGFPAYTDQVALLNYLNTVRPVTVQQLYVQQPIPETIDFTISGLVSDDATTRANIATSVAAMINSKAAPGFSSNGVTQPAQTIYAAWVSAAISNADGVDYFDLIMDDHAMPTNGSLAQLGTIAYA